MNLYIDTCVLPRCGLEEAALYRNRCGPEIGFELLPMFDIPAFEENLRRNLTLFEAGPLIFHEPVWGVEHTAEKGTPAWDESMFHLNLTRKYADILQPAHIVYHFNNGRIPQEMKKQKLQISLENLDRMHSWFPDTEILVENTGVASDGTMLLNQAEFTALCGERDLEVLIDVGHANANGWDLTALIDSLRGRIRGFHFHNNDGQHDLHNRIGNGTLDFDRLMPFICQTVPQALWVIEYTSPEYHGEPMLEDIAKMRSFERTETCQR